MSGVSSPPLVLRGHVLDRVARWGPVSLLPPRPAEATIEVEDWTQSGVVLAYANPRTERPC